MTVRYTEADPAWHALPMEQKYEVAISLRRQGWPYRRIAAAVGISNDTSQRWVSAVEVVRLTRAERARLAESREPVFPRVEVRLLTLAENTRISIARAYDLEAMPADLVDLLARLAGQAVPSLDDHDRALEAVELAAGVAPAAGATRMQRWVAVARQMLPPGSLPDVAHVAPPSSTVERPAPTLSNQRPPQGRRGRPRKEA